MARSVSRESKAHLNPLADVADWTQLLERSQQEPVILFKHDPYCGISAAAAEQVGELAHDVAVVDVAHQKPLSMAIARETGIRHESPQLILLRDGKATWSASHWSISADAVEKALEEQR